MKDQRNENRLRVLRNIARLYDSPEDAYKFLLSSRAAEWGIETLKLFYEGAERARRRRDVSNVDSSVSLLENDVEAFLTIPNSGGDGAGGDGRRIIPSQGYNTP